jgi:hypothetical protein
VRGNGFALGENIHLESLTWETGHNHVGYRLGRSLEFLYVQAAGHNEDMVHLQVDHIVDILDFGMRFGRAVGPDHNTPDSDLVLHGKVLVAVDDT